MSTRATVDPAGNNGGNLDIQQALRRGGTQAIPLALARTKRIYDHYGLRACTPEEAAKAAGWEGGTGGATSEYFHTARACEFLILISGRYQVTEFAKRLFMGMELEEAIKQFAAVGEKLYGVLEDWQDFGRADLVAKYKFFEVKNAEKHADSYLSFRPYWQAAKGGNIDEFARLLLDATRSTVQVRRRRTASTYDEHKEEREVVTHAVPVMEDRPVSAAPSAARPPVSLVPFAPVFVTIDCPACHGLGQVSVPVSKRGLPSS